jgi:hypothetical protein
MKQIEDKPKDAVKSATQEPRLPIHIPLSLVRWMTYSVCFALILAPGFWLINARGMIGVSWILGWFASQLNALINKKP